MDGGTRDRYTPTPVPRTSHPHPSPVVARIMRSDMVRWLAVLLVVPVLVFGVANGATFLAHGHDDHGMHLHAVGVLDDGKLAAADHAEDHGHDHAVPPTDLPADGQTDDSQLAETPGGVLVSFGVHKQQPVRGVDLTKTLSPAAIVAIVIFALPTSPDLKCHVGSPGGVFEGGPLDLYALRASDRLVRTSRALLI
jgi:hypothetical protein